MAKTLNKNKKKNRFEKIKEIARAVVDKIQILPSLLLTTIAISSFLILILLSLLVLPSLTSAVEPEQQLKEIKNIDSCAKIDSSGTYVLINDISDIEFEKNIGGCLVLNVPDIELDCKGHTISSSSEKAVGITINDKNVMVKNCNISMKNGTGIAVLQSYSSDILNNTLKDNKYGIFLYGSINNNINYNMLERNINSITLATSSDNNNITDNKIIGSLDYSLFLSGSSGNIINNLVISNTNGDALLFEAVSSNNVLNSLLISGTTGQNFDIKFKDTGNYNNTIKDSQIGRYDLNDGNVLNFIARGLGEVNYLEPISGIGYNLSDDIRILNNLIILSEEQEGLNKSAKLIFFSIPRNLINYTIMRDRAPCSQDICSNETAFDAGTVKIVTKYSGIYKISGTQSIPEKPKPFCIDSDNGKDFGTKGNVSYLTKVTTSSGSIQDNGQIESVSFGASTSFDYCISNITLVEYSCFSNETGSFPTSIRYNCPLGCLNSACITSPVPEPQPNQTIPVTDNKPKKNHNRDEIRFIPSSPRFSVENISFVNQEEFDLKKEEAIIPLGNIEGRLNPLVILLVILNILALILLIVFILIRNRDKKGIIENKEMKEGKKINKEKISEIKKSEKLKKKQDNLIE
ncbi:right-handed parallel beta-helix repeat-containing protein [Candidatus Pacearchaeota archaeon]|nr:right-handed parallel beta-helix repeat-containing protein [Candidatus Pacearchaeota archaeon]